MNREEYHEYLESAEWRAKEEAVIRRADGVCERCRRALADHVHHLHYRSVGHEQLCDLWAVCKPCHDYLGGFSSFDPACEQPDCDCGMPAETLDSGGVPCCRECARNRHEEEEEEEEAEREETQVEQEVWKAMFGGLLRKRNKGAHNG
jgi:hypothetical protein